MQSWKKLSPAEIVKRPYRADLILEKIRDGSAFVLCDGREVCLTLEDEEPLIDLDQEALRGLRFTYREESLRLSALAKTEEFGGMGRGAMTTVESRTLEHLRETVFSTMKDHKASCLPITVGDTEYLVDDVVTTPGVPKSDFHMTYQGEPVVWISHKAGKRAAHFQSWAGLSRLREPLMAQHPETEAFVADLRRLFPDGLASTQAFTRAIDDDELKLMATYGNEYGSDFSENNVQVIAQGDMSVVDGKLVADTIHHNGEIPAGEYEPGFSAIYKTDRSDYNVNNCRMSVFPRGGRNMKEI